MLVAKVMDSVVKIIVKVVGIEIVLRTLEFAAFFICLAHKCLKT